MHRIFWRTLPVVAVLFLLLPGATASAGIIFGDPSPTFQGAVLSEEGFPQSWVSDFALEPGANVVRDIHWWGIYGSDDLITDDDFTLYLFADNGSGTPENSPFWTLEAGAVARVDSGQTLGTATIYSYSLDILPLTLAAGETYYLSIANDTPADPDNWLWMYLPDGDSWSRPADTAPWTANSDANMGFYLTDDVAGVVPEPASLLLMGSGLGLAAFRRMRRRG